MTHPLLGLLLDAARGRPPAPDGAVEVLPGLPGPVDAVLAFTAHHVVVGDVDPALVAARLPDGDLSAPMSPAFLAWLAGRLGSRPGSLDVVLAAEGLGGEPPLELLPVADADRGERVARALRNRGLGRRLVAAARHLTPPGEPLFAQVAAGNAASLRAVVAAGFRPLGSEVLFDRGA
jgi:GNAT superfamily N-acetyltransferase